MDQEITVFLNGSAAGKAHIQKSGLYYQVACSCNFPEQIPYTLEVSCGNESVNLGTCIPQVNGFGLQTKIPVKRLPEGQWHIAAKPKYAAQEHACFPVRDDQPFLHLDMLDRAQLVYRDGLTYIAIVGDQTDSSRPTGQWSEPRT